ncbi:MAG TPA: sigma-54 dependent transcriptional regulator [Gemmatimonadales bacterium]
MPLRPALAVIKLSDSFESVWQDIADESGGAVVWVTEDAEPPATAVALVLAAGGEEERGMDALSPLAARTSLPLFLVGARASHRFAVEALRRGAADYFALPDDFDLLRRTLAARLDAGQQRARRSGEQHAVVDPFGTIIGSSAALQETLGKARRVLPHGDVTVLIGGETGTGKELLARALHEGGPRADGPFVAVNCAAIPAQLLESELFGHERGAFTDARQAKPGLFEEADGGTLFLDEVGHLPLPLQGKLLRALDGRTIRRVGATRERTIDVRIIAATHVDLAEAVAAHAFREDLFYRLNVVALTLPPLRGRGDDIAQLAGHFLTVLTARYGLPAPPLTAAVRDALKGQRWSGNIRELRHALERALLLSDPGTLDVAELAPSASRRPDGPGLPFPATLDAIEEAAAKAALELHDGNKSAAARQLGISRSRLQRLLREEDVRDA